MQQLTRNVWAEHGFRGCNCGFLVTREGVVMIDCPQRPTDARQWRQTILTHGQPRYLVNTEPHADHVMCDSLVPEATVIAHQGTRQAMTKHTVEAFRQRITEIDPESLPLLEGYHVRLPTITFESRLTLYLGDHRIELINLPGHTPWETAVYLPQERVLFTTDNVFYQVHTFLHEAVPEQWLVSLEAMKRFEADWFVPGHGQPFTDKAYLDQQAELVRRWIATIKEAVAKGWSRDETFERLPLLDPYNPESGGPERAREIRRNSVNRLYSLYSKE